MLDTLLLAIVTYNVYNFAVVDWGNAKALDIPTWYVRPFKLVFGRLNCGDRTFWVIYMFYTTLVDFDFDHHQAQMIVTVSQLIL